MAAGRENDFLHQSSDKMVTALGEAAKRPAPNATATATSTGTAKSDTPAQAAPGVTVMAAPAPAPVIVARKRPQAPHTSAPACDSNRKAPAL